MVYFGDILELYMDKNIPLKTKVEFLGKVIKQMNNNYECLVEDKDRGAADEMLDSLEN